MVEWQCQVCGYLHQNQEPPDECPVCESSRAEFIRLEKELEELEPAERKKRYRRVYKRGVERRYKV